MGSKRLTPTRVGKMASKCLLLLLLSLETKNGLFTTIFKVKDNGHTGIEAHSQFQNRAYTQGRLCFVYGGS